jgi:hypothetical protein
MFELAPRGMVEASSQATVAVVGARGWADSKSCFSDQ